MAPIVLEGDTLGEKHHSYNKLVTEELKKSQSLESIKQSEDDIQNLLYIDVASKRRDVDYILEVLKSEDHLYVSKAIKRSTWLIKDPQYAHIINPEYLYTQLYPQITTRAFNKLMLNIRLHLTDEKRVEGFYIYIKENNQKLAFKWLQYCSVPFVEIEIAKYHVDIPDHLVLQLFKKSFSIFEIYTRKSYNGYGARIDKKAEFLAIQYPDKFLDILETFKLYFSFSIKGTNTLMVKCPQRVLDKFEFYGKKLHLATFAKCLQKREDFKIADFLLKHAKNEKLQWVYAHDNIQHFIKNMPKENRFDYVKKVLIDKEMSANRKIVDDECRSEKDICCYSALRDISLNKNSYEWYTFAPFDLAFTDLTKIIRTESNPAVRNAMLQVLIKCAGRNVKHIQTVLQYYRNKHINEPFKFKIQFVNSFISHVDTHTLDDKTWNILNKLFHSMDVYIDSVNNVRSCVISIIIRNVIRNEEVPDIIKNKFVFDTTLKKVQNKLKTQEEKDAVFHYLQILLTTKSNDLNLSVEHEFNEAVTLCTHLLNLMKDWGKELRDHPNALDKVRELIKVKKDKHWTNDLSQLYKIKKSWRKTMFEESIALLQTQEVCMNALKHDPGLMSRYKDEVMAMCCNDTVSLRNLLRKMRIYWSHSLAEEWKNIYLERLDQPGGHKALVVGLCTLLPPKGLNELLNKYAPTETKINWDKADQLELNLRKQIAKNMYKARPLAPVEGLLLYAKGDYLQYAVPSLNAILSQLSSNKSRRYIPLLLNAPVSLQKFGVRYAFHKLVFEELKPMLTEIWNSTKNSSIRTVLFTYTFSLLCKEKNDSHVTDTWDILSTFIDKLTPEEDKLIYQKLVDVFYVPNSIRPLFFMKSYSFLISLPAKCDCESLLSKMRNNATHIMEFLDDDFVVNVLFKNVNEIIHERHIYDKARLLTSFILSPKDEETQIRRYEKCLAPLLAQLLPLWENVYEDKYLMKDHVESILERLVDDMDIYTFEKKTNVPLKVFELIKSTLERSLTYQKNYTILTIWKLVTAFVKVLDENSHVITNSEREEEKDMTDEEKDKMYGETHKLIAPSFVNMCVQYLKEDMNQFGKSIYSLFSGALTKFFRGYLPRTIHNLEHQMKYANCLLQYQDEREVWLVVYNFLNNELYNISSDNEKKMLEEIRKIVFVHPDDEVRMHFHDLFSSVTPFISANTSKAQE